MRGEIIQDRRAPAAARAAHVGIRLPTDLLLGDIGRELESLRVSMYFASSVPHAEKSQHVPPNWLLTGEFQFCPLTLRQSKLSAKAICDDEHMPIAKSTTIERRATEECHAASHK